MIAWGNLGMHRNISQLREAERISLSLRMLNKWCVVHLQFRFGLSHKVQYGIFHLWCHGGTQIVLDLEVFWISDFWMRYSQPVLSLRVGGWRFVSFIKKLISYSNDFDRSCVIMEGGQAWSLSLKTYSLLWEINIHQKNSYWCWNCVLWIIICVILQKTSLMTKYLNWVLKEK